MSSRNSSRNSPEPDQRHHSRTSTNQSASSYFTYPVSYAVSGLLRRLNSDSPSNSSGPTSGMSLSIPSLGSPNGGGTSGVFTPPRRQASPFQPPPLTPLTLSGYHENTLRSSRLMSRVLAEEIRLLFPARLQLVDNWQLAYSLEEHGVSLATLYSRCDDYRGKRGGYVLAVQDGEGSVFGAYLTDPPHPNPHFYGTGECFLWRASILPAIPTLDSLPPPPSADTTNATRMTTLGGRSQTPDLLTGDGDDDLLTGDVPAPPSATSEKTPIGGITTPDRIRFKAFPYSGINDYMIFCEHGYLSIGGGDGHYGLWLDDNLEKGVSDPCPTFGNECLSEQGSKFDVMGVEIWYIGT